MSRCLFFSQINLENLSLIRTFAHNMVLNYIWIAFFIIAFVIALVKLVFLGDFDVFPAMMDSTFSSSKTAFEISLGLTGVLSLWLGIMKIGEKGGIVNVLAKVLSPVFVKPQGTSRHGLDLHEHRSQHAGTG